MALDFTKLDKITFQGAETAQERQERDALLSKGFIYVDEATPFDERQLDTLTKASESLSDGLQPHQGILVPPWPEKPAEGKSEPFMSIGGRDYNTLYREAYNFHERHKAIEDTEEYWQAVGEDFRATSKKYGGQDKLLNALLIAVYGELERERDRLKLEPPPRAPYKAGAEIELNCHGLEEVRKFTALVKAGEAELIGKVIYHTKGDWAYIRYRLLVDEEKASSPLPRGLPAMVKPA